MKIISFRGGLGNQVFQYLFYLHLKSKYKNENIYGYYGRATSHNGLEIDKWFDVALPKQKWFVNIVRKLIYLPQHLNLKKTIINDENINKIGVVYEGWWQDCNLYMSNINNLNYKDNLSLSYKNDKLIQEMKNNESVAIHIRRGDYLLPQFAPRYANICTKEYYNRAINIIKSKVPNCKFYIFSNDMEWTKVNLNLNNVVFVDWNNGKDSFFDMYLMSQCKHHIIANSSFSLIGALMSKYDNQINICPKKWFNDGFKAPNIQPVEWIHL